MKRTLSLVALATSLSASAADIPPAAISDPTAKHAGHASPAAAQNWTRHPLIQRIMGKNTDGRGGVLMTASNMQADHLYAYAPSDATQRELELTLGGAKLEAQPKVGNYYWVTARQASTEQIIVAAASHYFSTPGPAPTQMLLSPKNELEIIPQPLPREHSGYRANETWRFLLRFNGAPLVGQPLVLETQNRSKLRFTSDASGHVEVRFPDDFRPESAPRSADDRPRPNRAGFVLATEHQSGGIHYLSSFNASYGPDAYTDRNLALGLGFTLMGGMLALPLLRNKTRPSSTRPTDAPSGA